MNCINNQKEITVGVDTGKLQLDIHIRPLDIYLRLLMMRKALKKPLNK
jgi:transposase